MINATIRIQKRLGGLETKTVVNYLLENDIHGAFAILLKYYDKFYNKSMHNQRENVEAVMQKISIGKVDPTAIAQKMKREYLMLVNSTSL